MGRVVTFTRWWGVSRVYPTPNLPNTNSPRLILPTMVSPDRTGPAFQRETVPLPNETLVDSEILVVNDRLSDFVTLRACAGREDGVPHDIAVSAFISSLNTLLNMKCVYSFMKTVIVSPTNTIQYTSPSSLYAFAYSDLVLLAGRRLRPVTFLPKWMHHVKTCTHTQALVNL
jgi:hypothetical protein